MTREVTCYITNNTSQQINLLNTNLQHGEFNNGGISPQTISLNAADQEVFYAHKTTGSVYGVTGSVTYSLPDQTQMQLTFNCPFASQGPDGNSNCWFYAGLLLNGNSWTSYYLTCSVLIDGQPMSDGLPIDASSVVANITINTN